jgi:hypothetical protein
MPISCFKHRPGDGTPSAWCLRCGRTWEVNGQHITPVQQEGVEYIGEPGGCFPLCEQCWSELKTADARLFYYRLLFDSWGSDSSYRWPEIEQAVRKEEKRTMYV